MQYDILLGARPFMRFIIKSFGVKQMIGEKLSDFRRQRHMTQQQLAKRLGVPQKSIKNWENNNVDPSIENLVRICDIFNVTADELLGRDTRHMLDVSALEQEDLRKLISMVQAYSKSIDHHIFYLMRN